MKHYLVLIAVTYFVAAITKHCFSPTPFLSPLNTIINNKIVEQILMTDNRLVFELDRWSNESLTACTRPNTELAWRVRRHPAERSSVGDMSTVFVYCLKDITNTGGRTNSIWPISMYVYSFITPIIVRLHWDVRPQSAVSFCIKMNNIISNLLCVFF